MASVTLIRPFASSLRKSGWSGRSPTRSRLLCVHASPGADVRVALLRMQTDVAVEQPQASAGGRAHALLRPCQWHAMLDQVRHRFVVVEVPHLHRPLAPRKYVCTVQRLHDGAVAKHQHQPELAPVRTALGEL
jgi:hypothetical protein